MDDYKHDCLVTRLVNTMAEAVSRSGGPDHERRKRALKDTVCTDRASRKVAEARFALAADDGAYMRMNVVPLQTVGADDDQKLTARLTPAMESAGYAGMLDTLDKKVDSGIVAEHARLNAEWKWVCWVLSIAEVCDYANKAVASLRAKGSVADEVAARAAELCLRLPGDLANEATTLNAACVIVRILSALFERPRSTVHAQLAHTFDHLERAQEHLGLVVNTAAKLAAVYEAVRLSIDRRDSSPALETVTRATDLCATRPETVTDANMLMDGLCAAAGQVAEVGAGREYAGVAALWADLPADVEDVIWPNEGSSATRTDAQRLIGELRTQARTLPPMMRPMVTESAKMVAFCLARGLCASLAPHHLAGAAENALLPYATPSKTAPVVGEVAECTQGLNRQAQTEFNRSLFETSAIAHKGDFCNLKNAAYTQNQRFAKWLPIHAARLDRDDPEGARKVPGELAVSEASVLEHLASHYRTLPPGPNELLESACAAFVKLKQLKSMAVVFGEVASRKPLAPATRTVDTTTGTDTVQYCTRPVQLCNDSLVYAFDAGLSAFVVSNSGAGVAPNAVVDLKPKEVEGRVYSGVLARRLRAKGDRIEWSVALQVPFDDPPPQTPPLLFIADPPEKAQFENGAFTEPATRSVSTEMLPPDSADLKQIEAALCRALDACEAIEHLNEEKRAIEAHRKSLKADASRNPLEDSARDRRHAVWNDSMREMAISGDRLYAFVRQLAGTINESVDAVCFVDDSMLVQQQNKRREVSERLAADAAKQHMQLVSQVFRSVISGSGLRLGIEDGGKGGDFTVVASELRKQVADLASGQGGEGFFSKSVRLENLLAHGTGEMTLTSLFERIKDVGVALQNAALSSSNDPGRGYDAPSLEFLSAPRNSLILRYKPEAHAAIRQAFEVFQREMRAHTSGMLYHRRITAFELIEGRSDELSMAFAAFCAHVLAGQRMFSASQAAYLGAFASKANLAAMKFALQKLVSAACRYLASTPEIPRFLDPNGRDQYFTNFH